LATRPADQARSFFVRLRQADRRTLVTLGGILLLAAVGLLAFRRFGVSWDEPSLHMLGRFALRVVTHGDRKPLDTSGPLRYVGPVVPTVLAIVDHIIYGGPGSNSPGPLGFQLGHLVVFSFFFAAVLALYGLCKRQFGSWTWGLLAAAIFAASPRIFSHAFVDITDTSLMALLVVAVYCVVRFLESRRMAWIIAAAVSSALAIDARINAVIIVGLTGLALLMDLAASGDRRRAFRELIIVSAVYLGVTAVTIVIFWPLLWSNPVREFAGAFGGFAVSTFYKGVVLYRGHVIPATKIPWHYVPWWIAITTPIPYLVLAAVGVFTLPIQRIRSALETRSIDRLLLVYAAWLFLPIVYVAAGHTVQYDEWRHMIFVYPPLVVFAVAGAVRVQRWLGSARSKVQLQRAWAILLIAMVGWVAIRMAELHPYEAVYFNSLVGGPHGAENRYEMDYWGLSYKEGLSYLLRNTHGVLKVTACTRPGTFASYLFSRTASERFVFVDPTAAQYAICAPRSMTTPYLPHNQTVYAVRRDGATLLVVKKLR